jgi:putative tricarboxylic transport membrane protein
MNRQVVISAIFWLGISIFVCMESLKSDVGSLHAPGPGFFPFWSAVVLGVFTILLVIVSALKGELKSKVSELWKGMQWQRVVWILCALFLYLLLLPRLGYLISTFGLMMFTMAAIRRGRLWKLGIGALIIVLASYLIFFVFLDVKLPKGIFGF